MGTGNSNFLDETGDKIQEILGTGNSNFLDEAGDKIQVAVKVTGDSIKFITVRFDQLEALPIEGDPAELLDEWQKKLGLKLKADGEIEPMYPVDEIRNPNPEIRNKFK